MTSKFIDLDIEMPYSMTRLRMKQLSKMRLVWVRFKEETYEQTPIGWIEAKVNEAEKHRKDLIEGTIKEIQGDLETAVWKACHNLKAWMVQEYNQLVYDYDVKIDELPSIEEMLDKALDRAEWEY